MSTIFNKKIILIISILVSIFLISGIFNFVHAQTTNIDPTDFSTSDETGLDDAANLEKKATQKDIEGLDDATKKFDGTYVPSKQDLEGLDDAVTGKKGDFYDASLDRQIEIQNARREARSKFTALNPIEGVTDASAAETPSKFFNGMFMYGISIAAFLAVIMIAVGGIQYMSTDAVSGKSEGRERITYAIIGLLLVLFSWILLKQINPEILNFGFLDSSASSGYSSGGGNISGSGVQVGLPTATADKIKALEDIIANGGISEAQKNLARQKILELKNQ